MDDNVKKNKTLERTLWEAADKLRKVMDAAEYKHVVLGLIFLKHISDACEALHVKLKAGEGRYRGADPEDVDEYRAETVFYVPPSARWSYLRNIAGESFVGKSVDAAMDAIEEINPSLRGVLPRDYSRRRLPQQRLGQLIDLIGSIAPGETQNNGSDLLGRVYEYFLGEFAAAEGKKGGQFYTPTGIVNLLVEMLEPYKGRVYDPCCGSGGMFVQSEKFVLAHQGRLDDISIYGQESNETTYRLCRMNLAMRGIDASNISWNAEGSFLNDAHPGLKADYILANPPFNDSDWDGHLLTGDPRWAYGVPPTSNANFAWIQHVVSHLSPNGTAGVVLSNGSLSSRTRQESRIRMGLTEDMVVECIVALPDRLFYNTGIPACLWILTRAGKKRRKEILFIDAGSLGTMINRRNRELSLKDIGIIAGIYHNWRSGKGKYKDVEGLCKSANLAEVRENEYILIPGRYVGIPREETEDDETFNRRMKALSGEITILIKRGAEMDREILEKMEELGFTS
jgi:type I restriction enzyme M protein